MKRRAFITLLSGAAVAWPFARAQQPGKPPTIGFMGSTTPQVATQGCLLRATTTRTRLA
jgi:hypothetical protein